MKLQAKLYFENGNEFLKRQMYPQAIKSYLDAISIDKKFFKAYSNLGVAYKMLGQFKKAENIYIKALKLNQDNGVIFNNLGNVYMQMNRLKDAEFFYLKAIKIYPDYEEAYYNLGQVYYFTGETNKALQTRNTLEEIRLKKT